MAFLKKVGNVLKESTSNPSLFVAIRSMFTISKIFVRGLSYNTDESETFPKYDEVVEGAQDNNQTIPLHTTHSPDFLGLNQNMEFWANSNYGRGVIIGFLDSGINPYHPSFNDDGMPPPPAKWRGRCEFNTSLCNNKLIGARCFTKNGTPYDYDGHGTHTAGTAAGNFVKGVNAFGNVNGTVAGIAPLAHIAVYKVSHARRCKETDIIAAMDTAARDGVDILSVSIGAPATDFFKDAIAIGAFRAMEKGILVCCSAGNSGPTLGTVENGAPWVLTVGASTMNRKIKGTIIGDTKAPTVASFSSRGPNMASPGILKPDIIGPGVNILAAWHKSVQNNTYRKTNFKISSGTSVSCPHLSGIAALLKSTYQDWSPAAIKSAIMTTADLVNLKGTLIEDQTLRPANVFATGSGHVNILKAADPGLVYDLAPTDYLKYLCGLAYTDKQISRILRRTVARSQISSIQEAELNYPSFSVFLGTSILGGNTQTYCRTVTNVGDTDSVYTVEVVGLPGGVVSVDPKVLQFSRSNPRLSYQVRFDRSAKAVSNTIVQGFLTWTSDKHSVRSPIVVTFL